MEYNKSSTNLQLREYGRLIQNMAEHLLTVEDRAKRTAMALETIRVMYTLFPQGRDMQEYKRKLWDHLHHMTNYKLDVDGPYPKPEPPPSADKLQRASYYSHTSKLKQYGKNVEMMIERALAMPEGPEREGYIRQIASYMRLLLSQRTNVRGNDPNQDAVVFEHLRIISGGAIHLRPDQMQLTTFLKDHPRNRISNASGPAYTRKRRNTVGEVAQKLAQRLKDRKKFKRRGGQGR